MSIMPSLSRTRVTAALLTIGCVLALTACAEPSTGESSAPSRTATTATATPQDTSSGATPSPGFTPIVAPSPSPVVSGAEDTARFTSGAKDAIALTTVGSSSCPGVPIALHYDSRTRITVQLRDWSGRACTSDLVPRTTVFQVDPAKLDTSGTVTLRLQLTGGAEKTIPVAKAG